MLDVNESGLQDAAALVQERGVRYQPWLVEVSNWKDMEDMAEEVLGAWDHIDILVNNAGVGVGGELKDVPIESIEGSHANSILGTGPKIELRRGSWKWGNMNRETLYIG